MQLLEQVRTVVAAVLGPLSPSASQHASRVAVTRDPALGDYQANVVFALAGELRADRNELAERIRGELADSELFERVEVAGGGFINMRLANDFLARSLTQAASDGRCGVGHVPSPATYVVDFSSPNVAKPMHVGHIRSTVIGDAIARTLRFLGHRVITDNHLGDWGTQFGMIIYGFKHFVHPDAYAEEPVGELSRLYRLVQTIIGYQEAQEQLPVLRRQASELHTLAQDAQGLANAAPQDKSTAKNARAAARRARDADEAIESAEKKIAAVAAEPQLAAVAAQHPKLADAALAETAALHAGDPTNLQLWHEFMPYCRASIEEVYEMLGVEFDHQLGESFYHDRLGDVVRDLEERSLAVRSEGAVVVWVEGFDTPMIVQKQDGAFLYATTDLATISYRRDEFNPDAMLYVVDHRQSEHFNKLFAVARLLGETSDLRHISFGTVLGQDGKPFKTRSGDVVGLESLLDEAIDRAKAVVCDPQRLQKASLQMSDEEQSRVATIVGLGAIKYADLSHHRTSDYVFDLDKMVQLEGNTAAYIQYSYARIASILRRLAEADRDVNTIPDYTAISLQHPAERSLAIHLLRFEDALLASMVDFTPNTLADYLFECSRQFAGFFDQCPVLRAESDTAAATRLLLCQLTAQVLRQGLQLLGIHVVERM